MLRRTKIFRISPGAGILFAAVVCGLAQAALAVTSTTTPPGDASPAVAPLIISGTQSARPAGTYSKSIAEIIKLLDARVDAQVVVAYVKNSTVPYQPDATELIALKEHGATTEVQLALVNRGGELRQQYTQAAKAQAAPAQSAVNPAPAAPAYAYSQTVAYPAYPASSYAYPDSYYAPYPATYYNYGYNYWPWGYWGGISFNWNWNNGRWCWSGHRNYGRGNDGFCWNGGNNTRFAPRTSHSAFAPVNVRSASPVVRSGGVRGSSGGMQFSSGGGGVRASSGGARVSGHSVGHSGGRSR